MNLDKAMDVLQQLGSDGFIVSIMYGRCACEVHGNTVGWSVFVMHADGPADVTDVPKAARSFEHAVEIAQTEVTAWAKRRLH